MKQFMKSNQGSALLLVIVVLLIAGILGVALTTLAVVNYNSMQVNANLLKAKYSAESGVDEVYSIINKEIQNTLKGIASEEETLILQPLEARVQAEWNGEVERYVTNENGDIDEGKVKDYIQNVIFTPLFLNGSEPEVKGFLNRFRGYFPDRTDENHLYREVKLSRLSSKYTDEDKVTQFITIEPSDLTHLLMHMSATADVKQSSSSTPLNKVISVAFDIPIPEYSQMITGEEGNNYEKIQYSQLKKNVLWTKAIVAGKDIVVDKNANVVVNGNLYAYGSPSTESTVGGIIVDGALEVKGNIETGGYLLCNSADSKITLNNKQDEQATFEVYSNSIAVKRGADRSKIEINGNVNLSDDIELNGKGLITINGNFYGFNNKDDTANQSSSILINYDIDQGDADGNEGIVITGNGPPKSYYGDGGTGTYIAGTAYIAVDELEEDENGNKVPTGYKYQTGESVAIRGNYLKYTRNNWVSLEENDMFTTNPDNIEFSLDAYQPALDLAVKIKEPEVDLKSSFGTPYKAAYMHQISVESPTRLLLGKGKIDIQNVKYSLGTYITKVPGNVEMKNDKGSYNVTILDNFRQNEQEYKYHINRMADPQNTMSDDIVDERLEIRDRFNFGIAVAEYGRGQIIGGQLLYASGDMDEDTDEDMDAVLVLKGNAPQNDEDRRFPDKTIVTREAGGTLEGIIVTAGDVYISGDLNYKGTIIAGGSIYIGAGNIQINNDYDENEIHLEDDSGNNYVIRTVYEDEVLKQSFQSYDSGVEYLHFSYRNGSMDPELYSNRYGVKVRSWKVAK